jgi:hypothetical protein
LAEAKAPPVEHFRQMNNPQLSSGTARKALRLS